MKSKVKKSRYFLQAVLLLLSVILSACEKGNTYVLTYEKTESSNIPNSGIVSENTDYRLEWSAEKQCLLMTNKTSGYVWSTVPYEFFCQEDTEGYAKVMMESALRLDYIEPETNLVKTEKSYTGVVLNGNLTCQKIDGGLELVYDFSELEISVPVQYILREDSLEVRIVVERIKENKNRVCQIALVPFFSSLKNSVYDGYLFIPSGCGGLMYVDAGERSVRSFSGEVYGADPTIGIRVQPENESAVRLPVFGTKSGSQALLGIIEQGAENAVIEAQAGDEEIGYSSVGAVFRLRGYTYNMSKSQKYFDEIITTDYVSVGYYPLEDSQANYTGMAKQYRTYLENQKQFCTEQKQQSLYLEFLGGALTKEFFLGLPYVAVSSSTTFAQAQTMLEELMSILPVQPIVNFLGVGDAGLDVKRICGGYTFNNSLGGVKGFRQLQAYCQQRGIPLLCDYNLLSFQKASNGYTMYGDAAKCVNGLLSYQYSFSLVDGKRNEKPDSAFLSRSELSSASQKLLKLAAKEQLDGVSLNTLGRIAYSDYRSPEYNAKSGMAADVRNIMDGFRQQGQTLLVKDANVYAASMADYISDIPIISGKYDAIDQEVPFYAMVFKGNVPLFVPPINLSANPRTAFLKAVETGSGLSFSLAYTNAEEYAEDTHAEIYCSQYNGVKETIRTMMLEAQNLYTLTADAKITEHRQIADGVYCTHFDNGTMVYVNYSSIEYSLDDISIPPLGFSCIAEGSVKS